MRRFVTTIKIYNISDYFLFRQLITVITVNFVALNDYYIVPLIQIMILSIYRSSKKICNISYILPKIILFNVKTSVG